MSLLDDLRAAAHVLDASLQPTTQELTGVLGAVVHFLEHGDELLKAVERGAEDVSKLLAPPAEEPAAPPADSPPPAAPSDTPDVPPFGWQPGSGDVPSDPSAQHPTSPSPSDTGANAADRPQQPTLEELEAQRADLDAQIASRQATARQTEVTHEPGTGPGG